MDEPVPWEIIQMPISACHQETSWDGVGVGTFLTVGMNEMGVFRTKGVFLDFEEIGIEFREKSTFHASEPTRERSDRCSHF